MAEVAVVLGFFLVLGAIGSAPAWLLAPRTPDRVGLAWGLAPVCGLAVIGLLGYPLLRLLGPLHGWSRPFLLTAAVLSHFLFWLLRRRAGAGPSRRLPWAAAAILGVCVVLLAAPFVVGGMNHSHFSANPSDAVYYMSQAESFRLVPWDLLFHSRDYPLDSAWNRRLAALCPAAFYSAPVLPTGVRIATTLTLGLAADAAGVPVYRLYGPFYLLYLLVAVAVLLALLRFCGASRVTAVAATAGLAWGYWPTYVMRADSFSQISFLPLILFVLLGFLALERESSPWLSPGRWLLSLAIAALITNYMEALPLLVLFFLIYYLWTIVGTRGGASALWRHAATAAMVVVLLTASGQILNYLRFFGSQTQLVQSKQLFDMFIVGDIRQWGLDNTLWGAVPLLRHLVRFFSLERQSMIQVFRLVTLPVTVLALFAAAAMARDWRRALPRALLSFLGAGLVLLAWLWWSFAGNLGRPHGKVVVFIVWPFLICLLALGPTTLGGSFAALRRRWVGIAAWSALGIWVVLQCSVPVLQTIAARASQAQSRRSLAGRGLDYEVTAITDHLRQRPPRALVVDVGAERGWEFPYYVMLALAEWRPYLARGIQNNNDGSFVPGLQAAPAAADYVVTMRGEEDRYGGARVAAQTGSLLLLRLPGAGGGGKNE